MTKFLRSVLKLIERAFVLSCRVLAAPLPGIDHILALTTLMSATSEDRHATSGCIGCGLLGMGCDAGRPHWIRGITAPGTGSDPHRGGDLAGM